MLYDIALIALGFALVAKGGDLFVDSSIEIGRALRIPRFVIGGTLLSLATTAPELVVSATASTMGNSGIALGNAIGSCICNIGFIVGTVALIMPVEVDRVDFVKRAAWMVAGGALVVVFSWDLSMGRTYGAVLLAGAGAYLLWDLVGIVRARAASDAVGAEADSSEKIRGAFGWFSLGGVFILLGSRLLVTSGQGLAEALGIPSAIIGFSIIAIGTSVPELVTGVTAARKGLSDLSLGNIIGANVLNLFLVVGISGTIAPIVVDPFSQWYAFPWLGLFFVAIVGIVLKNGVVRRAAGVGLLLLYALYAIGLVGIPMVAL